MTTNIKQLLTRMSELEVQCDHQQKQAEYQNEEIDYLRAYIHELKRQIFGQKSEKYIHPDQRCLAFEENKDHQSDVVENDASNVIKINA